MTPIESLHDNRLATLLNLTMTVIESLALETNCNPEQILSDYPDLEEALPPALASEPIAVRGFSSKPTFYQKQDGSRNGRQSGDTLIRRYGSFLYNFKLASCDVENVIINYHKMLMPFKCAMGSVNYAPFVRLRDER